MFCMDDWRLKEVMKDLGVTQEKLAEMLDCSKGQISMLLSGERKFHSEWIIKISRALNIPSWYLFLDPAEMQSDEEKDMFTRYKSAPEHVQQTIKTLLGMEE